MMINKNNYEAYFLDYLEGNLKADQLAALLLFLEENPRLKAELDDFEMLEMEAPVVSGFPLKDELRMTDLSQPITPRNDEDYFIGYSEGMLSDRRKAEVDDYVLRNPERKKDFQLYQQTYLKADPELRFPNRSALKKTSPILRRLYNYGSVAIAAAACLLLVWNFDRDREVPTEFVAEKSFVSEKGEAFWLRKGLDVAVHPLAGIKVSEVSLEEIEAVKHKKEVVEEQSVADKAPVTTEDLTALETIKKEDVITELPNVVVAKEEEVGSEELVEDDRQVAIAKKETDQLFTDEPAEVFEQGPPPVKQPETVHNASAVIASLVREKVLNDNDERSLGESVTARISEAFGGKIAIEKNNEGEVLAFGFRIGKFEMSRKSAKN